MGLANTPFENFEPEHSAESEPAVGPMVLPCDAVADLIPAYSIGAVDPEEGLAVNRRLAACPQAVAELALYNQLAEGLLYGSASRQAPTAVAARLRTKIGLPAAAQQELVHYRTPAPYTLIPTAPKQPTRRWTFRQRMAAAVCLLLLLVNIALFIENQQLRARQHRLGTQLAQQDRALILLAAEQSQQIVLPATEEDSSAQANIRWNTELGVAVVNAYAFPVLPPDQAYQFWMLQDGERSSGGLFTVDASGTGALVFPIQQPLDAYDLMGITPEPAGGSPGPTSPPVVRGSPK